MLTGHPTVLLVENMQQAADYCGERLGFDVVLYERRATAPSSETTATSISPTERASSRRLGSQVTGCCFGRRRP